MDCAQELARGRAAYAGGNYTASTLHFGRAHGACHDDKRQHLAAHWGLTRALLRQGHTAEAFKQWALGVFAAIFD